MKKANKGLPTTLIILMILTVFTVVGGAFFTEYLEDKYRSDAISIMEEASEQKNKDIQLYIKETYQTMNNISALLMQKYDINDEGLIENMKALTKKNDFVKMGISDKYGHTRFTDGMEVDLSNDFLFMRSIHGFSDMENIWVEELQKSVNAFSVPLVHDDIVVGVLYQYRDISELIDIMNHYNFYGKGCCVTNELGDYIFNANKMSLYNGSSNVLDDLSNSIDNKDNVSKIKNDLIWSKKNTVFLKNDIYIQYVPIGVNDWILISEISLNARKNAYSSIINMSRILNAAMVMAYVMSLLFIIKAENKNRKTIERIAYVDDLTGGISFEKFKKDVIKIIANAGMKQYAIISIDVDKFKFINDIFGYEEGNNVIRFIWKEINSIILEGEAFTHKRADEYVLLLHADDRKELLQRIEKLTKEISMRESWNEKNYEIDLSVGIYIVVNERFQIDTAIDRAELTKKSIKGKHSQFYAIYDDNLRKKIIRDQEIENKMESALENHEFKVFYQPKYASHDCKLVGAEALVRWYNDKIGMIFPNEFIPVFENNGFIVELDKYMFESVCKDIRNWMDNGYEVVPISVNLSQLQLYNLHFIDEYHDILKKYNVPPECVQLELTETTLFSEAGILRDIIDKLHKIGFKILMDDFGTGYSSLNMLKNIPIDVLKLDKSFVDDIGETKGDIVVSTIVELGQSLNMKIVAEGVETKEQFEFLRNIYCDEIQGYYFCRPISENDYRDILTKGA